MPSSRARRQPWTRTLHRSLLVSEALLVTNLLQNLGRDWVFAQDQLSPEVRVALGMALVVGLFGSAVVLLERTIRGSLRKVVKTGRRIPFGRWLVHVLTLGGLFYAYAWYWRLHVERPPISW